MKIKVCGMREGNNIAPVSQMEIDMMGFIFYPPSPRYVTAIPDYLPQNQKRVGVFVNEQYEVILQRVHEFGLDYIQLHGNESPEFCRELTRCGLKIVYAFRIAEKSDFDKCHQYEPFCELFLFDTFTPQYGGSGTTFDWTLLENYHGHTPFLLSGGIGIEDTARLQQVKHPLFWGVDINSRFETQPGIKDCHLIQQFIQNLKI